MHVVNRHPASLRKGGTSNVDLPGGKATQPQTQLNARDGRQMEGPGSPGYQIRRAEPGRLFGREGEEAECVGHWAALEALAPGALERQPPDIQELVLGENDFRSVERRRVHELPRWCWTTEETTKMHWQMLVEIGRCCPDKQKATLEVLRSRGAPLGSLLVSMDLWCGDSYRPGEQILLCWLLEHESTETIIEAQNRWIAHCMRTTEWSVRAWAEAIDLSEMVLRWRGLRAAWVSAVSRATPRQP